MPMEIAAAIGPAQIRTKDPDLSTYAADWMEDEGMYVARRACSRVPTTSIDGSYPIWDRKVMIEQRASQIGNEGVPARIHSQLERQSFRCKAYGAEDVIGAFTNAQAMGTGVMPEEHSTRVTVAACLRRMEQVYDDVVLVDTAWNGVATGQAAKTGADFNPFAVGKRGIQQVDNADAEPILDHQLMRSAFIKQTGYAPNVEVLGGDLAPRLFNHANVIDRVNRGQTNGVAEITPAQWGAAIRVPNIYIMESISEQGTFFLPTGFWMGYVDPNPGTNGVTAVSCFSLDSFRDGANISVDTRYSEDSMANIIRAVMAFDIHVVSKDLGIYCENYAG